MYAAFAMNNYSTIFVLVFLSIIFKVQAEYMDSAPVITLDYGSFQGITQGNVSSFLGIPFAEAPIGKLRFSRPQLPKTFETLQDATSYGAACPQQRIPIPDITGINPNVVYPVPTTVNLSSISEDCLFVNVIKPNSTKLEDKLPVLFWLFGGAFETGDTSQYPGEFIIERSITLGEPVIFVSANYRLNAFGFLSSQEVKDAGVSNLGLRDQRFALEWIQKNIKYFGGDPSRVTIWGESSGAFSIGLHMVINDGHSEGLFHSAFMESGSPHPYPDITAGQSYYNQLVNYANCSNVVDTLDCLRNVTTEVIVSFVDSTASDISYQSLNLVWQPSIDDDLITRNPQDSIIQGLYMDIPVVVGDCDDEGTLFSLINLNITTDDEFRQYIHENYIPDATSEELYLVELAYPNNASLGSPFDTGTDNVIAPQYKRLAAFQGDWVFHAPRRFLLESVSKSQNTWSFLYKRGKLVSFLGAVHTSDIPEFFALVPDVDYIFTDALIYFACNSNPNAPQNSVSLLSQFNWPKWNSKSEYRPLLTLVDSDPNATITSDNFRSKGIDLLTQLSLRFA